MSHLFTALLVITWSVPIFALDLDWPIERINLLEFEDASEGNQEANSHFHPCSDLNWTETQQKAYRQVRDLLKNEVKDLRDNLRESRKFYYEALTDTQSNEKKAHSKALHMDAFKKELRKARKAFLHTMFYDIFKADQRQTVYRCFNHFHHHLQIKDLRRKELYHQKFHQKPGRKTNSEIQPS